MSERRATVGQCARSLVRDRVTRECPGQKLKQRILRVVLPEIRRRPQICDRQPDRDRTVSSILSASTAPLFTIAVRSVCPFMLISLTRSLIDDLSDHREAN